VLKLRLEEFSFDEELRETLSALAPLAEAKGIEIVHPPASQTPFLVHADRTRLRQILFNLLG